MPLKKEKEKERKKVETISLEAKCEYLLESTRTPRSAQIRDQICQGQKTIHLAVF